jgi:HSP20 family protein
MAREERDYSLPARRPGTGLSRGSEPDFWTASPFSMMRRMNDMMDRIWGEFFGGPALGGQWQGFGGIQGWSPSVDVKETENEFIVHADLPGVEPEDLEVFCADDRLILRGETRREEEKRDQGYLRSERRYGRFERVLPLPTGVKQDQIQANFRNGVLELRLPKTEEARQQMRRIPIQGAQTLAGTKGGEAGSMATQTPQPAQQPGTPGDTQKKR